MVVGVVVVLSLCHRPETDVEKGQAPDSWAGTWTPKTCSLHFVAILDPYEWYAELQNAGQGRECGETAF